MPLSIDRGQAAEKAFNMAWPSGNEEDGLTIPDVELMIDDAARKVCDNVRIGEEYYRLHDPAITCSVSGGVGTLPNDVMGETIANSKGGLVTFVRSDVTDPQPRGPLTFIQDPAHLYRPRAGNNERLYFSVRGAAGGPQLLVFSGLGVPCSGTATVRACRYYTFENLPAQLEDEFLETLADMIKTRILVGKTVARLGGNSPEFAAITPVDNSGGQ